MADETYDASKIIVLEGAQGIRKRPSMYIGSTGPSGIIHLLYEVMDNAVDESSAGYCKNIKIKLYKQDGADIAEVSDDGRGIPVGIMEKYGKSALEVIMTTLHKGAKFENDVYKVSGGLHGVGLTVVNALSEFTEVTVKRNGNIYRQTFSRGLPTSKLEVIGETKETGTTVKFKPDAEIFSVNTFDIALLNERSRYISYTNVGLRIIITDERFGDKVEETYYSENGIIDFVEYINRERSPITSVIYGKTTADSTTLEYAMQYTESYDEKIESFVNSIKMNEGGTHLSGFHAALTRAITNYIDKNKSLNTKAKITGDDAKEGLTAIVSIKMQNPEFEGQTKEKLGNVKMKTLVETFAYQNISRYLEEHPSDAKSIIRKITEAANARDAARRARELERKKSIFSSAVLPGKLSDCILSDPEKTELFIVEGESAGGSSKQGRDKNIQAILPLRGKILNVEKASYEKIFDNKEIKTMITAFGTGINETFNAANIRYKKIIIMTDADVDGSHIRTLLLTFFYRYMRKIIELGYVYAAQPPLYKIGKGKDEYYCYSDEELTEKRKEYGENVEIQRYKGLGEMNYEQIWETTMNPKNRKLKKLSIEDGLHADELFTILMGADVAKRRRYLQEHAKEVKTLDI